MSLLTKFKEKWCKDPPELAGLHAWTHYRDIEFSMTQEQFKSQLYRLIQVISEQSDEHKQYTDYKTSDDFYKEWSQKLLELINQHVAEVIGEDDITFVRGDENVDNKLIDRNELRVEQRKRAGL